MVLLADLADEEGMGSNDELRPRFFPAAVELRNQREGGSLPLAKRPHRLKER